MPSSQTYVLLPHDCCAPSRTSNQLTCPHSPCPDTPMSWLPGLHPAGLSSGAGPVSPKLWPSDLGLGLPFAAAGPRGRSCCRSSRRRGSPNQPPSSRCSAKPVAAYKRSAASLSASTCSHRESWPHSAAAPSAASGDPHVISSALHAAGAARSRARCHRAQASPGAKALI